MAAHKDAPSGGTLRVALIVPTLNAGPGWADWMDAVGGQTLRPEWVLVIDSSSSDDTASLARARGFTVDVIAREDFGHGQTRQLGVESLPEADILLFLTQDAIPANPDAFAHLMACFDDPEVAAAYGRQLPVPQANAIAAHARGFNYPPVGHVRRLEDAARFGIKTSFFSNSFGAYRRTALMEIGGFSTGTIVNEDVLAAGKILQGGLKVAYCAEAAVYHSHQYTLGSEFKRHFDIGVFHRESRWVRQAFGAAEGQGIAFVRSELAHLLRENLALIPASVIRSAVKWMGYRMGVMHHGLPPWLRRRLSAQPNYWVG